MNGLKSRAKSAWSKTASIAEMRTLQQILWHRKREAGVNRQYLILRSQKGILAVYRIRETDKVLRRMKRWPKELEIVKEDSARD